VVRATAQLETAASRADVHLKIEVNDVNLLGSNIDLGQTTNQEDSGITIQTAAYDIEFGEKIEIEVPQAGSASTRGDDLLVTLQVIIP